MMCAKVMYYARASLLAVTLTCLPMTLTAFAQAGDPTAVPDLKHAETQDTRDTTGLWGLLGLLGLAGLLGRRRPVAVGVYDNPTRPRPETRTRP